MPSATVRRNVALLCQAPRGTGGRPSKSLTLDQARAVLAAAEGTAMQAYVVVSLSTGARTEELRALTWDHLHLDGQPPSIEVWRSVRRGGETKTPRSRRTLELSDLARDALRTHRQLQREARLRAGSSWGTGGWCSAPRTARNWTQQTCGARSGPWLGPLGWTGTRGHRVSWAQLRLAAVQPGDADRGHRAPGRARQHQDNGAGLPQGAAPGADQGCSGDGRDSRGPSPLTLAVSLAVRVTSQEF